MSDARKPRDGDMSFLAGILMGAGVGVCIAPLCVWRIVTATALLLVCGIVRDRQRFGGRQ